MLIRKNSFPRFAVAGIGFSAAMFTSFAIAASHGADSNDIQMRYRSDVASCNSMQSGQDKATCMKEARAALAEARRQRLTQNEHLSVDNITKRCDRLPADQRADCIKQMSGENTISTGSVKGGGILRETTIITTPAN